MAALALVVLLAVAAFHWLMEPFLQVLPGLMELRVLPWTLLALAIWLLAGRAAAR
ncbi:MAG: hypothetical protein VKK05_03650 [Synechococcus sp.]|jgi:hypothetical protein|nr:hypothetical protein [Synechococcus sp.]